MSITSLAHVCIKSKDLDATSRYYCDTLGMKKHFNFVKQGRVVGFYMKASGGNTFVEVFLADAPPPSSTACTLSHFCLETDNVEKTWQKLVDAGYAPKPITMGADGSPQFWMKDPNDMDVEFQQYTPESSQLTGRDVEVNW
jgi:catechol 2,3-dioxygenase-like lactoylglutathione lyase family enzyme